MPDLDHIFFYGSLMLPFPTQARLGVEGWLQFVAACQVRGALYDLGRYPGLAAGDRLVRGQLFKILDGRALAVLDRFEAYDPDDPAGSEYVRVALTLADRPGRAWVYLLNQDPRGLPSVADGDWTRHLGMDLTDPFAGKRP